MEFSNFLQLPPETICNILRNIHDVNTIRSIILSGNATLISLAFQCITRIYKYNPTDIFFSLNWKRPLSIIKQFYNLKSLHINVPINSLEDLAMIARLPHLNEAEIYAPTVLDYDDFYEILQVFISEYCQGTYNVTNILGNTITVKNNRNLHNKRFFIVSPNTFEDVVFDPQTEEEIIVPTKLQFSYINNSIIIFQNDINNNIISRPSIDFIIKFFTMFRRYSPLINFHEYILSDLDFPNLDILANYLSNIPELTGYLFLSVILTSLLNRLIDKIRLITQPSSQMAYPRMLEIRAFDKRNLSLFPPSNILEVFDVPVDIDDVPFILNLYPNVYFITIVHNKPISNEDFLRLANYPKLKRIKILTNNPREIPKYKKFYIAK